MPCTKAKYTPVENITCTTLSGEPVQVMVNVHGQPFWTVDPKHNFVLLDSGDGPEICVVDWGGEMTAWL
jgi:hypothetical protein